MSRLSLLPWRGSLRRMALCLCALTVLGPLSPRPARSETTLLRPLTASYATSGDYGITASGDWVDLSFSLFSPDFVSRHGARFTELSFAGAGDGDDQMLRMTIGRAWRRSLAKGEVLGFSTYLDLGKQAGLPDVMGQASFGVEYERARNGILQNFRLNMGSNLYLPFTDYTLARYGSDTYVPRAGLDGYMAWTRGFGEGLELGGRLSLFHYPATPTREAEGIGTVALSGRMTRYLPPGSALEAALAARYQQGEAPVPSLSLTYSRKIPHAGSAAAAPVGAMKPASACRIVPDERDQKRLDCGPSDYTPQRPHEVYGPAGQAPEVGATVPAPERNLGYGSLWVP